MNKGGFILRCFGTLFEYIYKVIMVTIYGCIVGFLTYIICSQYAPIDISAYNDMNWVLMNLITKNEVFGKLASLFYDMTGVAGNISSISEINVMKEICCGIIMTTFVFLATKAYGFIVRLAHIIFDGWHIRILTYGVNWFCTFLITLLSVIFSCMVTDTLFYNANSESYLLFVIIASLCFLGLWLIAKLLAGKNKSFVRAIFEIVLDVFTTIVIYFTIILTSELRFYAHSYNEKLLLSISLIISVGILTALFAYHVKNTGKGIFKL